ncbi:hypothetical protein RA241_003712 [Cronobacter sakazakii]|nr:hypothetical protein [Cronobacter sakazakii]
MNNQEQQALIEYCEDMRYRFVPASLLKTVCSDATHWFYMLPPVGQEEVAGG